jgi:hypothetical protein
MVDREIGEVLLCERIGWTLDAVRSLSPEDYALVRGVLDGLDKARVDVGKHGAKWLRK